MTLSTQIPAVIVHTLTTGPWLDSQGNVREGGRIKITGEPARIWLATKTPVAPDVYDEPLDDTGSWSDTFADSAQAGWVTALHDGTVVKDWRLTATVYFPGGESYVAGPFAVEADQDIDSLFSVPALPVPGGTAEQQQAVIKIGGLTGPLVALNALATALLATGQFAASAGFGKFLLVAENGGAGPHRARPTASPDDNYIFVGMESAGLPGSWVPGSDALWIIESATP